MRNSSFLKIILLTVSVAFFTSCDKDFNSIGDNLIGNEHFGLDSKIYSVVSYNQKVGPVQSNNLTINPLGVYNDPVFGTTEASFVTQVVLATENPVVGVDAEIESVILSIPYFSRVEKIDATTGDSTYILDSIYGNPAGKFKLSVYENGYFLRNLDPLTNFLEPQKFFTNQLSEFDNLKKPELLNDSDDLSQNEAFFFDAKELKDSVLVNGVKTLVRTAPQMRLSLNKAYFKQRILDAAKNSFGADPGKLTTNDVFRDYFRGLLFKVEKLNSGAAAMALLNFKGGTITIKYKENSSVENATEKVDKTIVLNLTGNTVSLTSHQDATNYVEATNPSSIDTLQGDPKLYLKGGQGAMTIIDLFDKTDVRGYDANGNPTVGKNGVPDELDDLRNPADKKKWLVNEANLIFHVDGDAMGTNKLPQRLYLYDVTNKRILVDYFNDSQAGFFTYDGVLNTTNPNDKVYKFRITNHITRLINNADSTNVKLGIVVTDDINNSTMNQLRLPLTPADSKFTQVPQASVLSPLGVILHGGSPAVPEGKKLKLQIYYTKPN